MCTVTWFHSNSGYDLFFNRDELRTRKDALPPQAGEHKEISYLAPTDSDRGGTWIGVNEHGVTHCLLNYYAAYPPGEDTAQVSRDREQAFRSRGEIVRLLQVSSSAAETEQMLLSWDLSTYPPFWVLVVAPELPVVGFRWDGREFVVERDIAPPVTTSSYRPAEVRAWRTRRYQRVVGRPKRRSVARRRMWRFHRSRNRKDGAFGVCMARDDARTVSMTVIRVEREAESRKFGTSVRLRRSPERMRGGRRPVGRAKPGGTGAPGLRSKPGLGIRPGVAMGYIGRPPCESDQFPAMVRLRGNRAVPEVVLDSRRLFVERAPGLARRLPPGTFALLRRVLHEDLLNAKVPELLHLDTPAFCRRVLSILDISVHFEGRENLRRCERPVVAANHPTGAVEGIALIAEVLQIHGNLLVPANEILTYLTPLAPVIVPLDRYRGNAAVARDYAAAYAGNAPLLVFPAGRTARMHAGKLREFHWQKSFVTHSRRTNRRIVPAWVSGRNSRRFYAIHRVRRALGIDLNIEMMFLIDELLRRRGSDVTVRFGPPLSPVRTGSDGRYEPGSPYQDALRAAEIQRYVESGCVSEESCEHQPDFF